MASNVVKIWYSKNSKIFWLGSKYSGNQRFIFLIIISCLEGNTTWVFPWKHLHVGKVSPRSDFCPVLYIKFSLHLILLSVFLLFLYFSGTMDHFSDGFQDEFMGGVKYKMWTQSSGDLYKFIIINNLSSFPHSPPPLVPSHSPCPFTFLLSLLPSSYPFPCSFSRPSCLFPVPRASFPFTCQGK